MDAETRIGGNGVVVFGSTGTAGTGVITSVDLGLSQASVPRSFSTAPGPMAATTLEWIVVAFILGAGPDRRSNRLERFEPGEFHDTDATSIRATHLAG